MKFIPLGQTKDEATQALLAVLRDGYMLHDIATSLTCTETNVIADFLFAHGDEQGARALVDAHSEDDDEGDDHYVPEDGAE